MESAERAGKRSADGERAARRGRVKNTLTLLGLTVAGVMALRPVRAPEENPRPLLQRAVVLRHAVAREPENALLLLQLARIEFRVVKMAALRDFSTQFPEGAGEPLAAAGARYEAWLCGSLYASPGGRRSQELARKAALRATSAGLRAEAYLLLGAIAWERGQEREALQAFRAACHIRPEWAPAWMRLAAAASARGDAALFSFARRRLEQLRPDADEPLAESFSLERQPVRPVAGGAPASLRSSRPGIDTPPGPAGGS